MTGKTDVTIGIKARLSLLVLVFFLASAASTNSSADYTYLFPDPLPGWTAGKAQAKQARHKSLGGALFGFEGSLEIEMQRLYTSADSDVLIYASSDSAAGQHISWVHESPEEYKPTAEPFFYKGLKAVRRYDEKGRLTQLLLSMKFTDLMLESTRGDSSLMMGYLDRIDLQQMDRELGAIHKSLNPEGQ